MDHDRRNHGGVCDPAALERRSGSVRFTAYVRGLRQWADVTVVDGSDAERFALHAAAWSPFARHLPVGNWPGRNRKVAGVATGVLAARHEWVVIAADDVRYGPQELQEVTGRLQRADIVRPQNVFRPLPWHACWDSARSLINRAFGSDYPGTLAIRRSTFHRIGGYDGDVLFENLQLLRTVRVAGGREDRADDVFVIRRPPEVGRFLEQRVRQAYDDFAQPARLVWEASWLPLLVLAGRRSTRILGVMVGFIAVAECGRRRHRGRRGFPVTAPFWAPLWGLQRAVTVWIAIGERVAGGACYRDERIPTAATRPRPEPSAVGCAA